MSLSSVCYSMQDCFLLRQTWGEDGPDNYQSGQQTHGDTDHSVPAEIVVPVLGGYC